MHAELPIDNSPIMLADEFPDMGYRSPRALGGSPVSILLYVADIDAQLLVSLLLGQQKQCWSQASSMAIAGEH